MEESKSDLEKYLEIEGKTFDIFCESTFGASCVSIEYKLAAIKMMMKKLEEWKEKLKEEALEE